MGKHTERTTVLVCTLSTQREGTIRPIQRGQISFQQPLVPIQDTWHKLF